MIVGTLSNAVNVVVTVDVKTKYANVLKVVYFLFGISLKVILSEANDCSDF